MNKKLEDFDVTTIWFGFDYYEGHPTKKVFQKVFYPKNCSEEQRAAIVQASTPDMLEIIKELAGEKPMIAQGEYVTWNLIYGEKCPSCGSESKESYPTEKFCRFCGKVGVNCCFRDHKCDKTKVRYWERHHYIEKIPDAIIDRETNRHLLEVYEYNERIKNLNSCMECRRREEVNTTIIGLLKSKR